MTLFDTYVIAGITIFLYMSLLFIIAIIRKDNSIADVAWGIGFITATLVTMCVNGTFGARNVIVAGLVAVWGFRLAIRIYLRNRMHGEDWRYRKWREEWGRFFLLRSYLQVFLLQGAILLVNISPVMIINSSIVPELTWLDVLGIALWLTGFFFEAVGDYQLDRFVSDPENRGKIMNRGLWRYSRHPNYFGEVTMWWGIFVIGLSVPNGIFGILGPVVITTMILFVSGIPMTERPMKENLLFQEYSRQTSSFFPWFPKKSGQ